MNTVSLRRTGLPVYRHFGLALRCAAALVLVVLIGPLAAQPVKISGGLVPGGDVTSTYSFSPDSAYVVFIADKDVDGRDELYSVRLSTGVIHILSGGLVSGGNVLSFAISPDGSRVVFRADKDTDTVNELYSVPIEGGTVTKLSGPLVAGGNVFDFRISPDGGGVVFRADKDTFNILELYSVPIAGGSVTKISGTLVAGGDTFNYLISPDGSRVVFRADKDTNDVVELYRVQIGGVALTMDVDGDDRILPSTDLLMFTRYQLGLRGAALIAGALGPNATITSATTIENRIRAALAAPGAP
jgi:Tol biopolymer transport system component